MKPILFLCACLFTNIPFLSRGQAIEITRKIDVLKFKSFLVDDTYDILVAYPTHYDSTEEKLPVLYIFDPDFYFLQFVLSYDSLEKRGLAPKALIVGVGYGTNFLQRSYGVLRDLTPSQLPKAEYDEDIAIIPKDSIEKYSGGVDTFIGYLKNELFPYIDANLKTDPRRKIAFGNGYGALFLCDLLMKEPTVFEKYNISSPLVWWDGEKLIKNKSRRFSFDTNTKVFFSYGQRESRQNNYVLPALRFYN